jgi:hypothetical protein
MFFVPFFTIKNSLLVVSKRKEEEFVDVERMKRVGKC